MNKYWVVAIMLLLAFVGYFHEYIFLGQDATIRVHDNLDGDVLYRHHLVKEGAIFAGPLTPIRPIMNGLPRVCLPSGLNIMVWLYWLFGTLGGFIASEFLVHILAYVGVYLLLKNHFLQDEKHFWTRHLAALFFASIPFFPVSGGAVAMQPMVLNAFLNIRKFGKIQFKDLLPIIAYPFYISFAWVGIFVLLFLGGFSLYNLLTQGLRKSLPFIGAVAILTLFMVIADHQLLMAFLSPGSYFVSHRTRFRIELNYNLKGVLAMGVVNAGSGIYHSATYAGFVFFLAPIIALVSRLVQRKPVFADKTIFILIGIFGFLGLMTTIWFWDKLGFLYGEGSFLTQINFSRFHYLLPLAGFALAIYAYRMLDNKISQYLVLGLLVLGIGVQCKAYYDLHHTTPSATRGELYPNITYRQYFSEDVFGPIKQACDQEAGTTDYNVIGLGIHPAVLQYNGFNTLDSYQNFYPLQYEQDFAKISAAEQAKCPDMQQDARFRVHNTCYLYSCEAYQARSKGETEYNGQIHELLLDPDAIQYLKGRFIVSRNEVLDFGTDRIRLFRQFEQPQNTTYPHVYLYQVL